MKAITPIVGSIIIIIIAIAVFVAVFEVMMNSTENARILTEQNREKELENKGKIVRINFLNLSGNNVEIINIGNMEINTSEIKVYIDNKLVECSWDKSSLNVLEKAICTFSSTCTNSIEVISPGGKDLEIC